MALLALQMLRHPLWDLVASPARKGTPLFAYWQHLSAHCYIGNAAGVPCDSVPGGGGRSWQQRPLAAPSRARLWQFLKHGNVKTDMQFGCRYMRQSE